MVLDQDRKQLYGTMILIKFISESEYEMRINFEGSSAALVKL